MKYRLLGKSGLWLRMFDLAADTFIRNGGAKFLLIPPSNERQLIYVVGGESQKDDP